MPELPTVHLVIAVVYLLAVGGVGAAAVLTGRSWLWWTLGALTLPLAGVVWVATLPGRRGAARLEGPDEGGQDDSPEPPTPSSPLPPPRDHTTPEDHRATPDPPPDDAALADDVAWLERRADALDD